DRVALYDHMKAYLATPPETLAIDEKNLPEHSILNCVGIVITTNYRADALYLPADDRRYLVAWSDRTKEDFPVDYWNKINAYYENGATAAVAFSLMERDITHFDQKAPPPRTAAFGAIVDNYPPAEEAELADLLDLIKRPPAFTLAALIKSGCQTGTDG